MKYTEAVEKMQCLVVQLWMAQSWDFGPVIAEVYQVADHWRAAPPTISEWRATVGLHRLRSGSLSLQRFRLAWSAGCYRPLWVKERQLCNTIREEPGVEPELWAEVWQIFHHTSPELKAHLHCGREVSAFCFYETTKRPLFSPNVFYHYIAKSPLWVLSLENHFQLQRPFIAYVLPAIQT